MAFGPRRVTLVLVDVDGAILGRLPEFAVDAPWWQEVSDVVPCARRLYGIDVTVLRLLRSEQPAPHGGGVEYLAEVVPQSGLAALALARWDGDAALLEDHPLRAPWARQGGPKKALDWADAELARAGLERSGPAQQIRTWNLSGLWRIPLCEGAAWLKLVPSFFAHEGALIQRLDPSVVPAVLAASPGRTLMAEIPGEDRWAAEVDELCRMVTLLVELQSRSMEQIEALLELGVADWRERALSDAIRSVVTRTEEELDPTTRTVLHRFVDGLSDRFESARDSGAATSIVHGDFHPGNVRGVAGGPHVLMDWGDAGVGHPLLDQPAFMERVPAALIERVKEHWYGEVRRLLGVRDPARASRQLAPIAAARKAVVYRRFLDGIEPSEHRYHRNDPADWLARTAALLRAELA